MRLRARYLLALALAGAGLLCPGASGGRPQAVPAELARLYAYDASAPLDVREERRSSWLGARLLELSYASPRGGRVPASLLLPASVSTGGRAAAPAVLIQHGAGSSRAEFLGEAAALARGGVAVMLIDAPMNRPPFPDWTSFTTRDRRIFVQNVVDWRRGIDMLAARRDIDGGRIAFVGHSYGGTIAAILAGVEQRLDAVVVMAAGARITDFLRRVGSQRIADLPKAKRARARVELRRYLAHMVAIDGVRYVPHATVPMLFQFGRADSVVPAREARALSDAAGAGNRVEWYAAGHNLDERARAARESWLRARLRVGG
jgi:predicted esterase